MKRITMLMLCGLLACGTLPSWGAPIHFATTKNETALTDALAMLSKQTGTPILTDDTVTGTLGATTLDAPTLDAMLTTLAAMNPGLTRQKVYLPKDAPLPTGAALYQQIAALQAIKAAHLIVFDPKTRSTVTFQQTAPAKTKPADATPLPADAPQPVTSPAPAETPLPDGMQVVYLVTNEKVRAQRQQTDNQPMEAKATPDQGGLPPGNLQPDPQGAASMPVPRAVNGLKSTFDVFSQMTPEQQQQALPLMFQQFQRIMQSIDPTVMNGIRQQMMQQWQQGRPNANP